MCYTTHVSSGKHPRNLASRGPVTCVRSAGASRGLDAAWVVVLRMSFGVSHFQTNRKTSHHMLLSVNLHLPGEQKNPLEGSDMMGMVLSHPDSPLPCPITPPPPPPACTLCSSQMVYWSVVETLHTAGRGSPLRRSGFSVPRGRGRLRVCTCMHTWQGAWVPSPYTIQRLPKSQERPMRGMRRPSCRLFLYILLCTDAFRVLFVDAIAALVSSSSNRGQGGGRGKGIRSRGDQSGDEGLGRRLQRVGKTVRSGFCRSLSVADLDGPEQAPTTGTSQSGVLLPG